MKCVCLFTDSTMLGEPAAAAAAPVASGNDSAPSALFGGMNTTDSALFANATISNSTNFLLDLLDENNMDANDTDMPFYAAGASRPT